ncbi:MAG: glycosyltransferase family 2 protein [Sphingomonadales bacterium]|nr:glycosyltransferase family 2 protein [Sphingomonadales bacterium]
MTDPLDDGPCGERPRLSVVIPCYNEEANLAELVRRVNAACSDAAIGRHEIVLVNDGSSDRSWAMIARMAEQSDVVVGVDLARNYGHQLALSAGLQVCRGDFVMVMDADLQDPPELLGPMLAKMAEGYDVVYGQRTSRAGETLFKRASASLFYRLLQKLVDVRVPSDTGDFRLMSRRIVDHLNAMPERYRFVRGMVSWIGFNQAAFPYERDRRFAGETKYPLRKMVRFAVDAVTSFSTLPLRLAAHIGLVAGLVGAATLGWVLVAWMTGHVVTGWTSLAGIVLLLGSVQLLMLGVFGEYLGRLYMESKQRPLYLIAEIRARRAEPAAVNPVHELTRKLQRAVHG